MPSPSWALRPMSGEGAGLEELGDELRESGRSLEDLQRALEASRVTRGPEYVARLRAAEALSAHQDPRAVEILLSLLNYRIEPAPPIRIEAVLGLARRIYDPKLGEKVWRHMAGLLTSRESRDPDPYVRKSALFALKRLTTTEQLKWAIAVVEVVERREQERDGDVNVLEGARTVLGTLQDRELFLDDREPEEPDDLFGAGAGLEEPAMAEEAFIRKIAAEIQGRIEPFAMILLLETGEVQRRLEEADRRGEEIDMTEVWRPFVDEFRWRAGALEILEEQSGSFQQVAEETDRGWSRTAEWRRLERDLRFRIREAVMSAYGLALTMARVEVVPPPEDWKTKGRGLIEREMYLRGVREVLTKGLMEIGPELAAAKTIPQSQTSLSDEEWQRMSSLQDAAWEYFEPIGANPLPMMFPVGESGYFHPSGMRVAAELMKRAGVDASSHVWDLGAGTGHALMVAAGVFGARGTGPELDETLAQAGQRWIDHNAEQGLIPAGKAQIIRGDLFETSPAGRGVTHLIVFPSLAKGLRERLDRWIVEESGVDPGTKLIVLATEEVGEDVAGFWPTLKQQWRLLEQPSRPKGAIFEKPAAGLEEPAMPEEVPLAGFLQRNAAAGVPVPENQIPERASRAFVAPLPSKINIYGQGAAMAAGLEEKFRTQGIPGVHVQVFEVPLAAGLRYEQPGVAVEDAGLGTRLENPQQLLVVTLWLSDLPRVHPAALILAALGALQHPDVRILGAMVYQNAQGQAMLVVFA